MGVMFRAIPGYILFWPIRLVPGDILDGSIRPVSTAGATALYLAGSKECDMAFPNSTEAALANLIHDLRQPLGNIETSVWCLSSMIDSPDPRIREQIALIERQAEAAGRMLAAAAAELSRARVQRAEAAVTLEMTNSAS